MWQLYSARVEQEEAIEDAGGESTRIQPRLHLLAIDLPLLHRLVHESFVVLHLWLFLLDLDHAVEVGDLHR